MTPEEIELMCLVIGFRFLWSQTNQMDVRRDICGFNSAAGALEFFRSMRLTP